MPPKQTIIVGNQQQAQQNPLDIIFPGGRGALLKARVVDRERNRRRGDELRVIAERLGLVPRSTRKLKKSFYITMINTHIDAYIRRDLHVTRMLSRRAHRAGISIARREGPWERRATNPSALVAQCMARSVTLQNDVILACLKERRLPLDGTNCDRRLRFLQHEFDHAKRHCRDMGHDLDVDMVPYPLKDTFKERQRDAAQLRAYQTEIELSEQEIVTIDTLIDEEWSERFIQTNVVGDGNCLFRAFADSYYHNEADHTRVRREVQEFWARAMGNFGAFGGVDANPVFNRRYHLYSQLLEQTRESASEDEVPDRRNAPLDMQINCPGYWASQEMLQVLADCYDVTFIAHMPDLEDGQHTLYWTQILRGSHPRYRRANTQRQIHVAFYPNIGHYTALALEERDDAERFTMHVRLAAEGDSQFWVNQHMRWCLPFETDWRDIGPSHGIPYNLLYLDYRRNGGPPYRPWYRGEGRRRSPETVQERLEREMGPNDDSDLISEGDDDPVRLPGFRFRDEDINDPTHGRRRGIPGVELLESDDGDNDRDVDLDDPEQMVGDYGNYVENDSEEDEDREIWQIDWDKEDPEDYGPSDEESEDDEMEDAVDEGWPQILFQFDYPQNDEEEDDEEEEEG